MTTSLLVGLELNYTFTRTKARKAKILEPMAELGHDCDLHCFFLLLLFVTLFRFVDYLFLELLNMSHYGGGNYSRGGGGYGK